MGTRRVVIGQDFGGYFGLKASLPGYDVLLDDENDANKFSFNSKWTDIVRLHVVGVVAAPSSSLATSDQCQVPFPTLPYRPFLECRTVRDGVIRDDWTTLRHATRTEAAYNYSTRGIAFNVSNSVLSMTVNDINTLVIYQIYKTGI